MTLRELRKRLQTAYDAVAASHGNVPADASNETAFAVGQALGSISKARDLVDRDLYQQQAAAPGG
ncbi:MAG TPA: hypothetical protein VK822_01685 [Acetobacteraceae bacterium]|jgi:hypothetical protein|nr:hypothetical protein [Acetobacteraceae bacterium]